MLWRLLLSLWCWWWTHDWRPYVSSVGWRGVRQCRRCLDFNPMEEWRE